MKNRKHGHSPDSGASPTYHTWAGMLARCTNPRHQHYRYYGGRGIAVCDRWHQFQNFLADMGEKPHGRSLDRINRDDDYAAYNCRWATAKEQARNKSTNRLMTMDGVTRTQAEWCELLGIHQATVNDRLHKGWGDAKALTTPPSPPRRLLTYNGETLSVAEWARKLEISQATIYMRLHRGASAAKALMPLR